TCRINCCTESPINSTLNALLVGDSQSTTKILLICFSTGCPVTNGIRTNSRAKIHANILQPRKCLPDLLNHSKQFAHLIAKLLEINAVNPLSHHPESLTKTFSSHTA